MTASPRPLEPASSIGLTKPARRRVGVAAAVLVLALAGSCAAAGRATRTFCGERQGTAGDAALVNASGGEVLVLATQGGDQHLLDQADAVVGLDPSGESGTQVGERYCLVASLDARGRPHAIISGRFMKAATPQRR